MKVAAKREPAGNEQDLDFAALYEAELTHVWRTLRRFGVRDADLEDLCHDVFVTFYRTRARFDATRPLRPWLSGIAFRVASDWNRRAQHRRELPTDAPFIDGTASPERRVDDVVAARQERELVLAALQAVEAGRRAVLVMHDLDEEPMPVIARALELPLNTAYSRLRLARAEFAEAVQRRWRMP